MRINLYNIFYHLGFKLKLNLCNALCYSVKRKVLLRKKWFGKFIGKSGFKSLIVPKILFR